MATSHLQTAYAKQRLQHSALRWQAASEAGQSLNDLYARDS
jgi:hypothetical protein